MCCGCIRALALAAGVPTAVGSFLPIEHVAVRSEWFALRPEVALDAPIFRTALLDTAQNTLWTTSPVVGSVGARAVVVLK